MAATSQPLATQVALDVLKESGNALDVATAGNAMQGLVEPVGCGSQVGRFPLGSVWVNLLNRLA